MPTPDNAPNPQGNINDPNDPAFKADSRFGYFNGRWQRGTSTTPADPAAPKQIDQSVQPTPYGGFDVAGDKLTGGDGLGLLPPQVGPGTPGFSVDSSAANEDRGQLASLVNQLEQQAATGSGAWESALKNSTAKANATATALGQSQPGTGYASELRNIGTAQGAVGQRAAGQAETLRNQSKLDATGRLADLYGGMGGQDASQAADAAAAAQAIRETDAQIAQNAGTQAGANAQTGGQAAATFAAASDGGAVPGRPRVFGDNEKNDTVPAMLSPGEIVIPRSHAGSPEDAAAFVRALHASNPELSSPQHEMESLLRRPQHLAGGGPTYDQYGMIHDQYLAGNPEKPSIDNGGLLNTATYDANRAGNLANSDRLAAQGKGTGPSVAPQMMQNATDETIGSAMRARGSASDSLMAATQAQQGAAGSAAGTAATEQQHGQTALMQSLLAQRGQDQSLALAKQQAAFRNTEINAGINANQQAQMRSALGAGGQGVMAYANAQRGTSPSDSIAGLEDTGQSSWHDQGSAAADSAFNESPSGDFPSDIGSGSYAAHGGEVGARKTTASARASKPAPRRESTVDVQVGEPVVVHVPNTVDTPEMLSRRMTDAEYSDFEKAPSNSAYAMGGKVGPDESKRAKAFLAALKKANPSIRMAS